MAVRILAAMVAACLVVAGCTTFPRNTPGTTFGAISVGSPRIEGRERLVNDRLDQEQWLQKQLTAMRDAEFGVSGITALTSSAFLGAQAQVNTGPQFRQDVLIRNRQNAALRGAADDDRAMIAFRAAARDEVIAKYNKKEITLKQAQDELTALGYSTSTAPGAPTATTPAASAPSSLPTAPSFTFLDKEKAERLAPPANGPRQTSLTSTPLELFQDRLAAAEIVGNELRRVRLDDVHDLSGNTLYRLAFDATITPHEDTSAWAVIRVRMPVNAASVDEDFMRRAAERHVRRLAETTEATYRTLLNNIKGECSTQDFGADSARALEWRKPGAAQSDDEVAVFRRVFLCASRDIGSVTRRNYERHLSAWSTKNRGSGIAAAGSVDGNRRHVQDLLLARPGDKETEQAEIARKKWGKTAYEARRETLREWAVWFGEIFDRKAVEDFGQSPIACYYELRMDASRGGAFPYLVERRRNAQGLPTHCTNTGITLADFQQSLQREVKASAYAATPIELVQRLSEVSSNQKTAELLLGLSALTGTAGVNAAVQSIRSNTALYDAIRRQPLAVGFTERGSTCSRSSKPCSDELMFGWILGPSFSLSNDGKSARFRHAVSQRSVSAELSLPGWLEGATMTVETWWQRENGDVITPVDAVTRNGGTRTGPAKMPYFVELPALASRVFATLDRSVREPTVDRYQFLEVTENAPASVLITGRDLWRSTQVYIGAQRATALHVLPGYSGIAAMFEKIAPPAGGAPSLHNDPGTYDLTVHTSEGITLAGRVMVRPADAAKEQPTEIAGMGPRIIAGADNTVTISKPLAATDEAVVQVTTPKDVTFVALLEKNTHLNQDRKTVIFALPAATVPHLKSGDKVVLSLAVKHGRTGGTQIFPIAKSAIYYAQPDDAKAKLPASAKPAAPIKFEITLPLSASEAFPGLASGVAPLTGDVRDADSANKELATLTGKCTAIKGKNACTAELATPSDWRGRIKGAKKLTLSVSFSGKDVPAFVNNTLELK